MADVPPHELRRLWEQARRRGVDLSPEQLCRDFPAMVDHVRELIGQWSLHSAPSQGSSSVRPDDTNPPAVSLIGSASGGASGPPSLLLKPGAEPVPGYRLVAVLGAGAFGQVWKATGPGNMPVALPARRAFTCRGG
jgi:hypothetical protein